ncbi:MAG: type III secretion inner membrane ring lipoprotein SctJ [Ectothiorhodospiraceae bacterium]|nr:type III secretion inner membrane ring lipoprotein SctJ [Ectothiorhodospiraceae bacterium]
MSDLCAARAKGPGRLLLLLVLVLVLGGCKEAVYTKLPEQHANEVLMTLRNAGIDADKRATEDDMFGVWVPRSDLPGAIQLLQAEGLPSRTYANMSEMFQRQELIASPTAERVRLIYGLEQQLADTLSSIDGVLDARVHLAIPPDDPLRRNGRPSSASVFLKHRADMEMQVVVAPVKDLVVRSVEGLSPDRVAVTLFPARSISRNTGRPPESRVLGARVAEADVTRMQLALGLPWVVVAVLLGLLLYSVRIRAVVAELLEQRRANRELPVPPDDELGDDASHFADDLPGEDRYER